MGWFSIFKPRSAPQSPFALGNVVLNELAEVKRQLAELQQQKPVQTHFANLDMVEELTSINNSLFQCAQNLNDHDKRLKDLDQKYISFLTSRICSASVQRRDKRGRFKAVRNKHASA